ncbi:MAG: pseudouridine synthase [Kofleriaceae bacterium]
MTQTMRLQRYLSVSGVVARRKAEELIVAGRVRVNGKQVRLLGTKVNPHRDHVTVDGEAISPRDTFYVVLNKPKGCVTAVEDDRGRPTIMEYLPNLPIPVKPVGRLDFYAEGVVLLTNDGDLASRLVSPQRHVPKTYHVKVRGEVRREHLALLRTGVRLEDGTTTLPAEVTALPGESRHSWLAITVIERKQHQVQRMMEALGYQVQKLQCVAFANLTFHGLRVGDARELTQAELNDLRDLVELDHRPVARGVWRTFREATDIPRRARQKQRAEAAAAQEEGAGAGEAPRAPARDDAPTARHPRASRGQDRDRHAGGDVRDDRPGRPSKRGPRGATRDQVGRAGARRGQGSARPAGAGAGPRRAAADGARPGARRGAGSGAGAGPRRAAADGARPGARRGAASGAGAGPRRAAADGARPGARRGAASGAGAGPRRAAADGARPGARRGAGAASRPEAAGPRAGSKRESAAARAGGGPRRPGPARTPRRR